MTSELDTQLLRASHPLDLSAIDTSSTPGFDGGKKKGREALAAGETRLAELQEKLFAESTADGTRSVLLVLQAMDTAGKGGIVSHVVGAVDPQGVALHAFKSPTDEEKAHDFLWRIRKVLPKAGRIGVFDRSHYEDVLIHRVRGFSTPEVIEERYGIIRDFEQELVDAGTTVIKVMLHISADEQKQRLTDRLADPAKHWKFNPGDLDERAFWPQYMEAYQIALDRTDADTAPWYVIPADHKWFARLAVQTLLIEALEKLDLDWPTADYDVEAEKARLAAS
ncbi:polyphosphate kinase 2 family protein [Schumannella luteola]|uniref:PPK2 family polyphosphate:nucleotide phosphotransferase n=1 Tax=Schumannella luteola TaxID=472059 RepID=A0A852YEM1_9MICO|nr:polyphosphate kinase 2 family protein [Schumannella luteola]NYG97558.1 PPK2 family polyphosphate:nucleotide phosphotransferase [Schumannella luteola]TPX01592.1 polyphosphate kinase 2 family protein [Schumannella luteola]